MRPLLRSSFPEEMAIWFLGGGVALALFTRVPSADGGDELRFDMMKRVRVSLIWMHSLRALGG